jgi:branched-chain amino acid transport system ATP-binding protein
MLLEVEGLTKKYGGVMALNQVLFGIEESEIVGLIGPNGSGKTTLLDVISGFLQKDGGRILYRGDDITKLKPHEITRRRIGRTFQVSRVFDKMTVLENLLCVPLLGIDSNEKKSRVKEVLTVTRLEPVAYEYAKNLSGGQRKLLEFARILLLDPLLLMMDEPFAGVDPAILKELTDLVKSLNRSGKSFLIVEHNFALITELCKRVIVLDDGVKIADGPLEEIQKDERVIAAYLGG